MSFPRKMWALRDAVLALLILAVAVGWFSLNGPIAPADGRGLGPGDDRAGESPLVVSGEGTQRVTAARETKENTGTGQEDAPESARETTPETAMEDDTMGPFLIGYIAGAVTVLTGVLVSPVAAWLWERIKTNR